MKSTFGQPSTIFLALTMGAAVALSSAAPGEAGKPNIYQSPDYCQSIEETGQLITIPWASEGCNADRESFSEKINYRNKFPGRYPPLTCVVSGHRFIWDAPVCTHARNQYAKGAIRPTAFGRVSSNRRTAAVAPAPTQVAQPSATALGASSRVEPKPASAPPAPAPAPSGYAEAKLEPIESSPGQPSMGAVNRQAGSQAEIPPVIMDDCKLEYSGGLILGQTGMLRVEFTNESRVTADLVRIRVILLEGATNIRDVGTFTPGISIKHRVRNEQGQTMVFPFFGGKKNAPRCSIMMVHFVDGTTWVSPAFARSQGTQ